MRQPHPTYKSTAEAQMFDVVVELMRSRKNTHIRANLRKLAGMVGYKEVPGEDSKVAAIRDWTAEIDRRFLK